MGGQLTHKVTVHGCVETVGNVDERVGNGRTMDEPISIVRGRKVCMLVPRP